MACSILRLPLVGARPEREEASLPTFVFSLDSFHPKLSTVVLREPRRTALHSAKAFGGVSGRTGAGQQLQRGKHILLGAPTATPTKRAQYRAGLNSKCNKEKRGFGAQSSWRVETYWESRVILVTLA